MLFFVQTLCLSLNSRMFWGYTPNNRFTFAQFNSSGHPQQSSCLVEETAKGNKWRVDLKLMERRLEVNKDRVK